MLKWIPPFVRANEGSVAIEAAIVVPMLALIMVPLIDIGMAIYQQMQVRDAAQAGAQYAMAHGWNSNAIQNAVTAATSLPSVTASPAPTKTCGCPSGTSIAAAACGTNCANGQPVGVYITVNAQATYTTLIAYPVLGSSVPLSSQATVRTQ